MGELTGLGRNVGALIESDPLTILALGAALIAFATTPIAFALLGRMDWFRARRGRVMQRPEFWSIVCSMLLVMGIPAIFAAIVLKSRHFDRDRYEFDPNQALSVLDQGRQYRTLKEADEAVRAERAELARTKNDLLNAIKKFDEALLPLRAAASQHPATYQALPNLLDRLAAIHKAVGLDAPQQLMVLTAPPAAITGAHALPAPPVVMAAPTGAPPTAPAPTGQGISQAEAEAEIATVPEPQRALAAMLPLTDVPVGWALEKLGDRHLETFNAENLYEKIDGRAESFIPYGVKGMAYSTYHPTGDEGATEVQVFVFEMGDAIRAFGKYGSEKPEEVEAVAIGKDGYVSAGSVFFYYGPYYTQIISSTEGPESAAFALEMARKVAVRQGAPAPSAPSAAPAQTVADAAAPNAPPPAPEVSPEDILGLLPKENDRSGDKYAAQDVFGYAFLSNVFMADYADGKATWQGFLRPYANPEEAKAIFEKYISEVKSFGARVEELDCEDADRMVRSNMDGLIDVVFLKGNAFAGANGGTEGMKTEAFSRAFASQLPRSVPALPTEPASTPPAAGGGDYGEK